MRRRNRTSPARRLGLIAVAAGLAAAVGAAGARLAGRRRGGADSGPPASHPVGKSQEEETYTCECGQAYRVTGVDRHRVFYVEGKDEPVLGSTCVNCDAPLPAGHDASVA